LKEGRGGFAGVAKGSGIWPVTVGIRRKEKRGWPLPKISLRY